MILYVCVNNCACSPHQRQHGTDVNGYSAGRRRRWEDTRRREEGEREKPSQFLQNSMEGAHDGNFLGCGTGAEQEARAKLKGVWEEKMQRIAVKQV